MTRKKDDVLSLRRRDIQSKAQVYRRIGWRSDKLATTVYTSIAAAFERPEKSIAAVDFLEIQPSALLHRNYIVFISKRIVDKVTTRESYDSTATRLTSTFNEGK